MSRRVGVIVVLVGLGVETPCSVLLGGVRRVLYLSGGEGGG